jgi:membrane protease YdiL (CAAX protease family)
MSLLAWGLHRIGLPRRRAIGAALAVAALAFGLGHLPALAQLADPTPLLVLRTVFLNALGGLVFGWLYAVRGLEAAMVAHAASHLVFFGARLAGIGV